MAYRPFSHQTSNTIKALYLTFITIVGIEVCPTN